MRLSLVKLYKGEATFLGLKHMIILWIIFIIEPPCQSNEKEKEDEGADKDYHRNDEQVNLCLECKGNLKHLKKKYLRISSQATICHLKKFLALKVFNDISKYGDVSLTVLNFNQLEIVIPVNLFIMHLKLWQVLNNSLFSTWTESKTASFTMNYMYMYEILHQIKHKKKTIFSCSELLIFFPLTQVEILCNDELLGKGHTLKFVAVTRWRIKVIYMNVWNNT